MLFNIKKTKGYSGTATFVKSGLTHDAKVAFGTAQFDDEGRVVMTDHGAFVLFNVYFPNSGKVRLFLSSVNKQYKQTVLSSDSKGEDRRQFKVAFYHWFRGICDDLIAKGRQVIVCGDVNTTHKEIDYHGQKLIFSDEERGWLDLMFDKSQFVDMFRCAIHYFDHGLFMLG
jgi:exodeoxyribonuclease-3